MDCWWCWIVDYVDWIMIVERFGWCWIDCWWIGLWLSRDLDDVGLIVDGLDYDWREIWMMLDYGLIVDGLDYGLIVDGLDYGLWLTRDLDYDWREIWIMIDERFGLDWIMIDERFD